MLSSDDFILAALADGAIWTDPSRGMVFGSRWRSSVHRGCLNKKGYVVFTLHLGGQRKQVKAHRVIWLSVNGKIPCGMIPDHKNRKKNDN